MKQPNPYPKSYYSTLDDYSSIPAAFFKRSESDNRSSTGTVAYRQLPSLRNVRRLGLEEKVQSVQAMAERVSILARHLKALGVKKGERVAIISNTRPEWLEADLAIQAAGATSVGIYHSLPVSEVGYILFDSGATVVFVENAEQLGKLRHLATHLCDIPETEGRAKQSVTLRFREAITFENCEDPATPSDVASIVPFTDMEQIIHEAKDKSILKSKDIELTRSDVAAIVYTSGTTGPPKGVIQSHHNHLSNVRQVLEAGLIWQNEQIFLFLPLAHSFARLMANLALLNNNPAVFCAVEDSSRSKFEPEDVIRDIRRSDADVFPVVPRFLEKIQEALEKRALGDSLRSRLLAKTLTAAAEHYAYVQGEGHNSFRSQMVFEATRPIRKQIVTGIFGRKFRACVSGGAKLPATVNRFYDALGIEVLEGYGLTETCVATNCNPYGGKKKIGTVGPVLTSDIQLKISNEGEILFRGPNISLGYLNRPVATAEAWDNDGFYHTGDLGSVDADGFLTITGRKKELIVTSGGKKVAPYHIEERIAADPLVSHAVLIGDDRPFCIAIITLNPNASTTAMPTKDDIELVIREHINELNAGLPSFETVKGFIVLDEDFSIENGLLTPTLKVKRKVVEQRYADKIEKLYKELSSKRR